MRRCMLGILLLSIGLIGIKAGGFDTRLPDKFQDPPFLSYSSSQWVDSLMQHMSLEDKICQLFMIAAYSNRDESHFAQVEDLVRKYHVGGIIFFQGGPMRQAILTNRFQTASPVPLLIGMDAEWGLAMRLDSTVKYPFQLMLGALDDDRLIYDMGRQIAWQMKRLGVQVSFSPDVDINNNPQNPVISMRSFGEDRFKVAIKGIAYAAGLQSEGIIAVGKHFPGHGDTNQDSHLTLPVVTKSREHIDSIELFPFKYLIQSGVSGIMTAHLNMPALDTAQGKAASMSSVIIRKILRQELGFHGLVFTDALNMKGVAGYYTPGTLEVNAMAAGNDILVMPSDVPLALQSVLQALSDSVISVQDIDEHCRRVLLAKKWVGLDHWKPVRLEHLANDLNNPLFEVLQRKLLKTSLILAKNQDSLVPLNRLDTLHIASVNVGSADTSVFQRTLSLYAPVDHFSVPSRDSSSVFDSIMKRLQSYNLVIISFTGTDMRPVKGFGLTPQELQFVDSMILLKPVILALTANPYSLPYFKNIGKVRSLILAFNDYSLNQDLSAELIFGGIVSHGKLPVTIDTVFHKGTGIVLKHPVRFYYTIPEELGIPADSLAQVDSIVWEMIHEEAAPGCQIFASVNGNVFFRKAYGWYTYQQIHPVSSNDLYDLASVTKISSTLPAVMHLVETGVVSLKGHLGDYLPEVKGTNKSKLVIQDILAHQAGLESWIPFYTNTLQPLTKGKSLVSKTWSEEYPFKVEKGFYIFHQVGYRNGIYKADSSVLYPVKVADHLWLNKTWMDTIFHTIYTSPVSQKKRYLYSDLGFVLLYRMVESTTGQPLDKYVNDQFYRRLGAWSLTYNPLRKFDRDSIAPTENDLFWRRQLVQGYVHDMTAAMLGGVCGHAGLFANANDLAKLMQVYLNGGTYGGITYFNPATISQFSSCAFPKNGNRRGLGFDKPLLNPAEKGGPACTEASPQSFGHTGFTGTYTWMDPSNGLLYIFLSNRVYPTSDNPRLVNLSVRTNIQSLFYRALNHAEQPEILPR